MFDALLEQPARLAIAIVVLAAINYGLGRWGGYLSSRQHHIERASARLTNEASSRSRSRMAWKERWAFRKASCATSSASSRCFSTEYATRKARREESCRRASNSRSSAGSRLTAPTHTAADILSSGTTSLSRKTRRRGARAGSLRRGHPVDRGAVRHQSMVHRRQHRRIQMRDRTRVLECADAFDALLATNAR